MKYCQLIFFTTNSQKYSLHTRYTHRTNHGYDEVFFFLFPENCYKRVLLYMLSTGQEMWWHTLYFSKCNCVYYSYLQTWEQ